MVKNIIKYIVNVCNLNVFYYFFPYFLLIVLGDNDEFDGAVWVIAILGQILNLHD